MKNGFTLIELLAVIVILAIIALIAVPIILNIINTAREESNKRSIELYASAVRNSIAAYQLKNPKPPKTFSDLAVEYKGDVECSIKELYLDGSFYLEGCRVNKSENEYSYGAKQGTGKPCRLEDLDQDGKASLSDIITCGTESFYVMTNENNEITMLSMYNLYVGEVVISDGQHIVNNEPIENPTNRQSDTTKGTVLGDRIYYYGRLAFSTTKYWESTVNSYPEYVYNENSNLYQYVNEYERILKEEMKVKSAKTSLISYEQLVDLGCNPKKWTCGPDLENPAPSWVYSTSYWSGTASKSHILWIVQSNGDIGKSQYNVNKYYGIRPVVIISVSEI